MNIPRMAFEWFISPLRPTLLRSTYRSPCGSTTNPVPRIDSATHVSPNMVAPFTTSHSPTRFTRQTGVDMMAVASVSALHNADFTPSAPASDAVATLSQHSSSILATSKFCKAKAMSQVQSNPVHLQFAEDVQRTRLAPAYPRGRVVTPRSFQPPNRIHKIRIGAPQQHPTSLAYGGYVTHTGTHVDSSRQDLNRVAVIHAMISLYILTLSGVLN